ncbi:MAG: DNA repair protein RadC [Candidatus Methanofastidiosia archaeon]|jgi:DNA repair protein RadC
MGHNTVPKSETPKTRLTHKGGTALSLHELLTIIVSGGNDQDMSAAATANDLLEKFNGHFPHIFSCCIHKLLTIKGMNHEKACVLSAINEISKRLFSFCENTNPQITCSNDIAQLLTPFLIHLPKEEFWVVLVDLNSRVIHSQPVSTGSLTETMVCPRDIFKPALDYNAASIFLIHNHPSGDPQPSDQDMLLTRELEICGMFMGIDIKDHIIIGKEGYISIKKWKMNKKKTKCTTLEKKTPEQNDNQ